MSPLLQRSSAVVAVALAALGSGCSSKETVRVSLGKDVTADAGAIELSFREIHATYERPDGKRGAAAPYVKVHGGWLEIAGRLRIAILDNIYELTLGACTSEERRDGDFVYQTLTGCEIEVDSVGDDAEEIVAFASSQVLALDDRYAATKHVHVGDGLVAVRSTGFTVGDVDVQAGVVSSMRAGLDIVTSFGVQNLDYDGTEKPILGNERSFELGPQRVFVKILDVGNTNTHCQGGCRNVLDVEVRTEALTPGGGKRDISVSQYR